MEREKEGVVFTMTTLEDLPVFTDVDEKPVILNGGTFGKIVVINYRRQLVAKVLDDLDREGPYALRDVDIPDLQGEYRVQRFFYDHDISVPKPEGVFAVPLANQFDLPLVPALVMEYIDGRCYDDLNSDEAVIADSLFEQEYLKVLRLLGRFAANRRLVSPFPDHNKWSNTLYSLDQNKAVFIDFGRTVEDFNNSIESTFGLPDLTVRI